MGKKEIERAVSRLYAICDQLHEAIGVVHDEMQENMDFIKSASTKPNDIVDFGYLMREICRLADDLRLEAKVKRDLIGKIVCFRLIDPNQSEMVGRARGKLATGSPDLRMIAPTPKKGTPEYEQLLTHYGVTQEAIDQGLFALNWKRFMEFVTTQTEDGAPLPPGLGEPYPDYRTTFRSINTDSDDE